MTLSLDEVQEITVVGQALGQEIINVFHYARPPGDPPPDPEEIDILTEFREDWQQSILPRLHQSYSIVAYRSRTISGRVPDPSPSPPPPPGQTFFIPFYSTPLELGPGAAAVGSKTGPVSPTFVAVGSRKRAQFAGRNFRGSARFGPIQEDDTTDNSLIAVEVTAWAAALEDLRLIQTIGPVTEAQLVVFSYTRLRTIQGPGGDTPIGQASFVNQFLVKTLLSSQVSRKAGGGAIIGPP